MSRPRRAILTCQRATPGCLRPPHIREFGDRGVDINSLPSAKRPASDAAVLYGQSIGSDAGSRIERVGAVLACSGLEKENGWLEQPEPAVRALSYSGLKQ